MSETFEEWCKSYFTEYELENDVGAGALEILNDLWNHQKSKYEKKIDELEKENKRKKGLLD